MIFPIFASVLVFCLWLAYEIKKSKKKAEKSNEAFWAKEAQADNTPKKSLDDLRYITIPETIMSLTKEDFESDASSKAEDPAPSEEPSDKVIISDISETPSKNEGIPNEVIDSIDVIHSLNGQKIVNLSNITNTDLKLTYGTANLSTLTAYDQNYLSMSRALLCLSDYSEHIGKTELTKTILEFVIATGNDSIRAYKTLGNIYASQHDSAKLTYLMSSASLLTGLTKGPITTYLQSLKVDGDKDLEESIFDILE